MTTQDPKKTDPQDPSVTDELDTMSAQIEDDTDNIGKETPADT